MMKNESEIYMDAVYRLSIYIKHDSQTEPVLAFRRLYAKKSSARGVATLKKNGYRYGYDRFHHATIETFSVIENETETVV